MGFWETVGAVALGVVIVPIGLMVLAFCVFIVLVIFLSWFDS